MKISFIYYTYKMNVKIKFLEESVNFDHSTKKQNKYFKVFIFI